MYMRCACGFDKRFTSKDAKGARSENWSQIEFGFFDPIFQITSYSTIFCENIYNYFIYFITFICLVWHRVSLHSTLCISILLRRIEQELF